MVEYRIKAEMMWDILQKFGLGYCDLPTMLWNVSITLRPLTVNINRRNTRIPILCYIFTGIIASSYLYVYGVSNMWFVLWRCRETRDMISAAILLSIQLASEIGPLKMIFMLYYKSNVMEIVEKYLEYDASVKSGKRYSTLSKQLRTIKKRALIFWFIVVGNCVVYLIKPLLLPGNHFMEDHQIILGLEPMYQSPNYEIAYLLTVGGTIFILYSTAHTTEFFIVLIGYTEAQLFTMSESLMFLWDDAQRYCDTQLNSFKLNNSRRVKFNTDKEITSKMMNDFVKKHLNKIINHHTTNIHLINQIEQTFRGCIVIEFILLSVALVAELLGGLENTYMGLPFSLLLVSVDCFMGQKLMNACESFSHAVYGCRWENFDLDNMKTTLIILTNSQKPLTLTVGGIRVLNFVYLGSIIQTIYSAFTTLKSVVK